MSGKCDPESEALWSELRQAALNNSRPAPEAECCRTIRGMIDRGWLHILSHGIAISILHCPQCGRRLQ
ncbi:MAG: hypothetical protein OHK006_12990 [Thermodesulfovibrionales bacterium]